MLYSIGPSVCVVKNKTSVEFASNTHLEVALEFTVEMCYTEKNYAIEILSMTKIYIIFFLPCSVLHSTI